ncbi:hypothetical protein MJO28_009574 [Puccinia striiformis f. sp. tritici]|uniref:Uncharacterized protein n=1 Tax=Puccinia striiformis f. sp. tritici TaxID=168172 RepID=A0ACC0E9Q3_9BASI|nr:hypothetical protein MJO28_009574 [Puccinia striiformis f. sp. tritici]
MLRLTPVLPIKHHVKLRESASLSRNERDVVKISSECDAIQTAGGNFLYLCDHRINRPYRLYTVVRPMLDLVDKVTNWYICFNRRRLKGENGPEDAVIALNTLFETLFTLCRTVLYLHSHPSSPRTSTKDFKVFSPKKLKIWVTAMTCNQCISSVSLKCMLSTRSLLDKPNTCKRLSIYLNHLNLDLDTNCLFVSITCYSQTPLQELVVFHTNPEYHEDVNKLQNYVEDELNVHQIIYSKESSESETWLRGDNLRPTEELSGDIKNDDRRDRDLISRYVDKELPSLNDSPSAPAYENNTDEDAVILLNCNLRPELESEGFA